MCIARESRRLLQTPGIHSGWTTRAVKAVQTSTDAFVAIVRSGRLVLESEDGSSSEEAIVEWLEFQEESLACV